MYKKITFCIVGFLFFGTVSAQTLYQPKDIEKAYQNETRSLTGAPGKAYWQNSANYNIKLAINPPSRRVKGEETIVYRNNSPHTLTSLNFKLVLNHHKPGAARLAPAPNAYITDGIQIDHYEENGKVKAWDDTNDGTNKSMPLEDPLLPNQEVTLTIHWSFDLSVQSGREGVIDETTFFLAYFYPRVSVYDDYQGWDTTTFYGAQEFYNDFNDYEVEVTVPKNYIVWATGDLLNPTEVLQAPYAKKLAESMQSDQVIQIAGLEDLAKKQVTKQGETNTWKWKATSIPDFAIGLSDHYIWDAGSVVVDLKTKRRASVQAAYDEPSEDFKQMVDFGKNALHWFSTNVPGVPYPYSKSTIIRGFADMEYPMMVNDNSQENPDFSRLVAAHEIAHTYFPFYMGTNEARFGFMDEGWATALEYLIGINDFGEEKAAQTFKLFRVNSWVNNHDMEVNIPVITPTNALNGPVLRINQYSKPALAYLALRTLLGEEEFIRVIQAYMHDWNGKHPTPWDFFYSVNTHAEKNLNWFWKPWFFSQGTMDVGIEKVDLSSSKTTVKVRNHGGMPVPFTIKVTDAEGRVTSYPQSPAIWEQSLQAVTIELNGVVKTDIIQLEGGIFMDADLTNNEWKRN